MPVKFRNLIEVPLLYNLKKKFIFHVNSKLTISNHTKFRLQLRYLNYSCLVKYKSCNNSLLFPFRDGPSRKTNYKMQVNFFFFFLTKQNYFIKSVISFPLMIPFADIFFKLISCLYRFLYNANLNGILVNYVLKQKCTSFPS